MFTIYVRRRPSSWTSCARKRCSDAHAVTVAAAAASRPTKHNRVFVSRSFSFSPPLTPSSSYRRRPVPVAKRKKKNAYRNNRKPVACDRNAIRDYRRHPRRPVGCYRPISNRARTYDARNVHVHVISSSPRDLLGRTRRFSYTGRIGFRSDTVIVVAENKNYSYTKNNGVYF